MPVQKIATCCYCGTRAVLTLRGTERHELACAQCGAPLHDLKQLPKAQVVQAPQTKQAFVSIPKPASKPKMKHKPVKAARPAKRRKRGKSFAKKAFEEIFDVLEDIFD
ncbi:MAG: hypothetical protein AAGD04_09030 [Pseudomonadota bacterium]